MQGTTVYLPCTSGIVAVAAVKSPAALHLLWSSGTGGGPAIVAAGLVWTIGQNGTLYGLSPATGTVRQQASIGVPANHFPTPSAADGLLLAPSADHVVAFAASGSGSGSGSASAPASASASSSAAPPPASGGVLPAHAIAGIVVAALALIGGMSWLAWRRRATGSG